MKLLRHNKLTRLQISTMLGWNAQTVDRWTREYEATGILVAERAPKRAATKHGGALPKIYTLAPAWQGQATC